MTDTLMTIIGIFIAVVLMFLFPLMEVAGKNDDISQTVVQIAAANFVNEVAKEGKITRHAYDELITKTYSTGNTYDVIIEARILDDNPERRTVTTDLDVTESQYYSVYTNTILDKIEEKERNGEAGEYLLKKDDYILVTIKNNNITLGSQLKGIFYKFLGKDTYAIGANASALVINTGEIQRKDVKITYIPPAEPQHKIEWTVNLKQIITSPEEMKSFNIVYILDYSGSMGTANIDRVNDVVVNNIKYLKEQVDLNNSLSFNVSVVVFASGAGEVINETINVSTGDELVDKTIPNRLKSIRNLWSATGEDDVGGYGSSVSSGNWKKIKGLRLPYWFYEQDYDEAKHGTLNYAKKWQSMSYLRNKSYKYSYDVIGNSYTSFFGGSRLGYIGASTSYSNALKVAEEVISSIDNGYDNYVVFMTDGGNSDGAGFTDSYYGTLKIGTKARYYISKYELQYTDYFASLRSLTNKFFIIQYEISTGEETKDIDLMESYGAIKEDANGANLDITFKGITHEISDRIFNQPLNTNKEYEMAGINADAELVIEIKGVNISPNVFNIKLSEKTNYDTGEVDFDGDFISYSPEENKYYIDVKKMISYFEEGIQETDEDIKGTITLTYYVTQT